MTLRRPLQVLVLDLGKVRQVEIVLDDFDLGEQCETFWGNILEEVREAYFIGPRTQ